MNILDIFKSAISVNPDSVYVERFDSGDFRCIFPEEVYITINECKIPFRGRVFQYDGGSETLETFWGVPYYCSSKDFLDFIAEIETLIGKNNFCPAKFKSLKEELLVFEDFNIDYKLE